MIIEEIRHLFVSLGIKSINLEYDDGNLDIDSIEYEEGYGEDDE